MAEPILKWAGGKRQVTEKVLAHFPFDYKRRRFHEPMVGAGAIAFLLEPREGSINDINERLMNMYRIVRDSPDELIAANRKHVYEKDYYYRARRTFNSSLPGATVSDIDMASLMIFLNKTCWNGLYRVNSKGEFNVPFGGYRNPDFIQEDRIRVASKMLKNLKIMEGDYSYVVKESMKGDIVYFDPPYQPVSATSSFTSYNKDGFGLDEQTRLRNTILALAKKGVLVIMSNSDAPDLVALYEGLKPFRISHIRARRAINCNGSRRGEVGEIIVTNVPETLMKVRL